MYNCGNYGFWEVSALDCMKCGKELKNEGVFCPDCLAEMEKYPVKPNITVQLPPRRITTAARKKARRQRYVKAEDQIRHLKTVRNRLIATLVAVILLFSAAAAATWHYHNTVDDSDFGQNYGSSEKN